LAALQPNTTPLHSTIPFEASGHTFRGDLLHGKQSHMDLFFTKK
jgi:hypothetical protein